MNVAKTEVIREFSKLTKYIGLDRRIIYQSLIKKIAPSFEESILTLQSVQPFLVTSTGRTGTLWLSNILNQIPNTCVVHEPSLDEQYDHVQALNEPDSAQPYLRDFRLREMKLRIDQHQPEIYGEVNGALRHHLAALRTLLPTCKIIHLVRDGRDVVASYWARRVLTDKDKIYTTMRPPTPTLSQEEWQSMDRFSQLCWLWTADNSYIRKYADSQVRFEDMLHNYSLFKKHILDPLNLVLDQNDWEHYAKVPLNTSNGKKRKNKTEKLKFSDWTDQQKQTFWQICGSEMAQYGYPKEA